MVVGNPKLLCRDMYWRALLEYCIINGSYRGAYLCLCVCLCVFLCTVWPSLCLACAGVCVSVWVSVCVCVCVCVCVVGVCGRCVCVCVSVYRSPVDRQALTSPWTIPIRKRSHSSRRRTTI